MNFKHLVGYLSIHFFVNLFFKGDGHTQTKNDLKLVISIFICTATEYRVIDKYDPDTEQLMMDEIQTNGSIVAVMKVYSDFENTAAVKDAIYKVRQKKKL